VDSELLIAFTVAPCNENDKLHFEPLLERVHRLGVRFRAVLVDAQYSSENVRNAAEWFDAEPVIPVRRYSGERCSPCGTRLRREWCGEAGAAVQETLEHREAIRQG
jgi:uncharacterized protein with PIN domain